MFASPGHRAYRAGLLPIESPTASIMWQWVSSDMRVPRRLGRGWFVGETGLRIPNSAQLLVCRQSVEDFLVLSSWPVSTSREMRARLLGQSFRWIGIHHSVAKQPPLLPGSARPSSALLGLGSPSVGPPSRCCLSLHLRY